MTGAINLLRTQPDFARLQPASGKQIQNKDAKKIVQYLVKLKIRRNFASQSESSAVGSALRSGRRGSGVRVASFRHNRGKSPDLSRFLFCPKTNKAAKPTLHHETAVTLWRNAKKSTSVPIPVQRQDTSTSVKLPIFLIFLHKTPCQCARFQFNAVIYTTEVLNNLPTNGNFPAVCVSYCKQNVIDIMTEEQLTKGLQAGDNLARKELYERLAGQMLSLCRRYVGQSDEAEDLLHDGFLQIFSQIGKFTFTWRRHVGCMGATSHDKPCAQRP